MLRSFCRIKKQEFRFYVFFVFAVTLLTPKTCKSKCKHLLMSKKELLKTSLFGSATTTAWPEMTKFCHSGKFVKGLSPPFLQLRNLLWQFYVLLGKIFNVVTRPNNWTNTLAIWSHWCPKIAAFWVLQIMRKRVWLYSIMCLHFPPRYLQTF